VIFGALWKNLSYPSPKGEEGKAVAEGFQKSKFVLDGLPCICADSGKSIQALKIIYRSVSSCLPLEDYFFCQPSQESLKI
jgi:hypothetical protein